MAKNVLTAVFVCLVVANFASWNIDGFDIRFEYLLQGIHFTEDEIKIMTEFRDNVYHNVHEICDNHSHYSVPKVMETMFNMEEYIEEKIIVVAHKLGLNNNASMAMINRCKFSLGIIEFKLRYTVYIMSVCWRNKYESQFAERVLNATLTFLSFMCDNDASNLISFFLEQDYCTLFQLKHGILKCKYSEIDFEDKRKTNETLINKDEDYLCIIINLTNECIVNALKECNYSKSADDIIISLFKDLLQSTLCWE